MTKKTPFNQLSKEEQEARIAYYEKQRAERGTTQVLARLVKEPRIKDISNGNRLAIFRVTYYSHEDEKPVYMTTTAFIGKGKEKLEAFYASLQKGQLISLEYKKKGSYNNVYNIIDRSYVDKKNEDTVEKSAKEYVAKTTTNQNTTVAEPQAKQQATPETPTVMAPAESSSNPSDEWLQDYVQSGIQDDDDLVF